MATLLSYATSLISSQQANVYLTAWVYNCFKIKLKENKKKKKLGSLTHKFIRRRSFFVSDLIYCSVTTLKGKYFYQSRSMRTSFAMQIRIAATNTEFSCPESHRA